VWPPHFGLFDRKFGLGHCDDGGVGWDCGDVASWVVVAASLLPLCERVAALGDLACVVATSHPKQALVNVD
jgi:hypothetical protein